MSNNFWGNLDSTYKWIVGSRLSSLCLYLGHHGWYHARSSQSYQGHTGFGEYVSIFISFFFKKIWFFLLFTIRSRRFMVTAGTRAEYLKWKLHLSSLMNVRLRVCVSATRHQFKQDFLNKKFILEIIYCREVYCRNDVEIQY